MNLERIYLLFIMLSLPPPRDGVSDLSSPPPITFSFPWLQLLNVHYFLRNEVIIVNVCHPLNRCKLLPMQNKAFICLLSVSLYTFLLDGFMVRFFITPCLIYSMKITQWNIDCEILSWLKLPGGLNFVYMLRKNHFVHRSVLRVFFLFYSVS